MQYLQQSATGTNAEHHQRVLAYRERYGAVEG
jgi:hypothetical protein